MPRPTRLAAWVLVLCFAILPLPDAATAQGKMVRVGVLSPFIGPDSLFFETLRHRLHELGWVEARNVAYVYRAAEEFERLQAYAHEMVALKVDVIVTAGPQGVRAAKTATSSIPIVMGNVGDAVRQGFVASLARPGGNITGLSSLNTELSAKRLTLLKEALPRVSRVAVLREAVGESDPLRATEATARSLGLTIEVLQVRDSDELAGAFAGMASAHVGALEILPGSMFVSQLRRIVQLATAARLPAIYPDHRFVRAGGLMSYGSNIADLYGRAAEYVDRLLRGAKPSDLPVEQPTTFALAVNLKAAQELGVTIPPAFLMRADELVR